MEDQSLKAKRERSPNFPYESIGNCIELAHRLLDAAGSNMIHYQSALTTMGLNATSSTSRRTLSALLSYGLLRDEGARTNKRVGVTDVLKRIVLDTRKDSQDRIAAIQEAVLKDSMMREVWAKWGRDLPRDDNTLETMLRLDLGFSDRAVTRFRIVVRENYEVAKLSEQGAIGPLFQAPTGLASHSHQVTAEHAAEQQTVAATTTEQPRLAGELESPDALVRYQILLDDGPDAWLLTPRWVSQADYDWIATYLDNFKSVLLKKHLAKEKHDAKERQEAQD